MLHRMLQKKVLVSLVLLYICNIVTFFSILIYKNKEIKGYLWAIKSINPIFIYIYKKKKKVCYISDWRKFMKKSESEIEEYLVKSVKNKNGLCVKWTSPGNAGVPDRIVIVPGGDVYFVELKAEGKRENLSPSQRIFLNKLKNLNCDARVIASFKEVDKFIDEVMPNEVSST